MVQFFPLSSRLMHGFSLGMYKLILFKGGLVSFGGDGWENAISTGSVEKLMGKNSEINEEGENQTPFLEATHLTWKLRNMTRF